jgi:glycosyltransferase involved in cell wall biosynthesis
LHFLKAYGALSENCGTVVNKRETVALVQRYIPHYRLPLFERLAQLSKYDWEFLHGDHPGKGQSGLETTRQLAFPTRPIQNSQIGKLVWQRGITGWLKQRRYQAIVVGLGLPIVSNIPLLITAHRLGIPSIGWSKGIAEGRRKRPAWLRLYERLLTRRCKALIVYGQVSANYFVDLGFPAEAIFIARNTVDTAATVENIPTARSRAIQLRSRLGLDGQVVIGYLGRLVPEKGIDQIIRAFSQAKGSGLNACLLIAGDGPERKRLESLARNSSASRHIHFCGQVPVGEQDAYFQMFDLFVSARNAGLAILEAMANAKAVLITPETRPEVELVEDGVTGFVAQDFSTSSLAEGMLRVVSNLQDVENVGLRAQARVLSRATLERMVEAFDLAVDFALTERQ